MQLKKYLVLGTLFILPLTMYLFFASGKDNFARLPVLTNAVEELNDFKTADGKTVQLSNKITVLGFFGNDFDGMEANAYNLSHKIYKKNYQFHDFQFVFLAPQDAMDDARYLTKELEQVADPKSWHFAFGSEENIEKVFNSLETDLVIDPSEGSNFVFIIDKDRNLRGRDDDEDVGVLYGFDARNYAEINNKMGDDIKVILAEYRLELKKYKANREI